MGIIIETINVAEHQTIAEVQFDGIFESGATRKTNGFEQSKEKENTIFWAPTKKPRKLNDTFEAEPICGMRCLTKAKKVKTASCSPIKREFDAILKAAKICKTRFPSNSETNKMKTTFWSPTKKQIEVQVDNLLKPTKIVEQGVCPKRKSENNTSEPNRKSQSTSAIIFLSQA